MQGVCNNQEKNFAEINHILTKNHANHTENNIQAA